MTTIEPLQSTVNIPASGGEMDRLIRTFDWSGTPLGAADQWPQSLQTAMSILLASTYPMYIGWGPQYTVLYNDAYRSILGPEKHPAALGKSTQEVWHEIWDLVGPWFDEVVQTGNAIWREDQLYAMERKGYREEAYFTFSYSAIHDESHKPGGVFVTVIETTERVLGERRLTLLHKLGHRIAEGRTPQEAIQIALQSIETNPFDIPFSALYLLDDMEQEARLAGTVGIDPGDPMSPPSIHLREDEIYPFQEIHRTRQSAVITGLSDRFANVPQGPWLEAPHSVLVLPLIAPGQKQEFLGFFVAGVSARLELDKAYRNFFELCAGQVVTALTNALAYEEERKRAQALADLNAAKIAFFSNVSHEFRTPLTLLLGPLEDLVRGSQGSALTLDRETAESMHRNTLRLLKLVNTLLDFSRIEAGRSEAVFEPTDLSQVTEELVSVFRSAIEQAGLQLRVSCPPLAAPVYVDHEMWEKIVLNLISNAFKFTLEGTISVDLRQDGDAVRLIVSDTGVGIPAHEVPHIFERFHRVHNTRARTFEGTGIGLSLVDELVRLHGGTIQVESQEGVGSTFTVSMPTGTRHLPPAQILGERALTSTAIRAPAYVEEARRWLGNGRRPDASSPPEADEMLAQLDQEGVPPGRILVVDDNADMREYLRRLLQQYWSVDAAADGGAALAAIERQAPDLILTDVMMPNMDGFTLLERVRANPETAHIPVVMLSARAGEEASAGGLAAGANDYLIKPFSARELFARVRTQLATAHEASERRDAERRMNDLLNDTRALYEISRQIAVSDSAESILRALAASSYFKENIASGFFWFDQPWLDTEPEYGDILAHWSSDPQQADLTGVRFSFRDYGLALLSAPDRPVFIRDSSDSELTRAIHEVLAAIGSRSFITIPLVVQGLCRGYMFAHWNFVQNFTEHDIRLMHQLVDLAAAALYNILLLKLEAEARQAAEQAVELKTRFLAMISHELRTPLTSIKGFATTLLSPDVQFTDQDQRDFIEIISDESDKLRNLVEQLLDLTRMQAGSFSVQPQPITLHEIMESSMAQLQSLCPQHDLSIHVPKRLPRVSADKIRVGQVLSNLVHNACKFSPAWSQVSVTASREGQYVQINIADKGPGIPPEERDAIFQPFRQIESVVLERGSSGVGLGLAIARGIVEAHGGRIWVQDQDRPGTTISFRLPLAPDHWHVRLSD